MDKILRNGIEVLTREDIEHSALIAREEVGQLRTVFAAIVRLQPDGEIHDLAKMGKDIADITHNDLDVLHEHAEMVGVIGELIPEGSQ
jgi:hypothetical protein